MSSFARYLTVWVGFCIVVGVALGHVWPWVFQAVGSAEVAQVNLPVAMLIWLPQLGTEPDGRGVAARAGRRPV